MTVVREPIPANAEELPPVVIHITVEVELSFFERDYIAEVGYRRRHLNPPRMLNTLPLAKCDPAENAA
ncbi:MAG: hypothetical protein H0W90_13085 [Actinobacteria bacterium]|nr:hypothetical protein [Actinomycetota bacterium]